MLDIKEVYKKQIEFHLNNICESLDMGDIQDSVNEIYKNIDELVYQRGQEIMEILYFVDVIDRAEAMTEIMMFAENVKSDEEDIYIKVSDAVQLLRDLPSVTAQPKKGHWIKIGAYQGKCSCCNNCVIDEDENFGDYCRHCGADMRGDE